IAWRHKDDFIYRGEPLAQAIARASKLGDENGGPILLLDHADNCASGATQDTMYVLKEALRQGLTGIAVGPVRDPEAVGKMITAGVGAKVTLELGGKMDMPAIKAKGESLEVTGVVRAITDGEYTITGPQFQGMRCYMGRTAVLDTGAAEIGVTERKQAPGHRPGAQPLPAAEVAHVFPPRVSPDRERHGVLRCAGRRIVGLAAVQLPQAAPADLPAGYRIPGRASLTRSPSTYRDCFRGGSSMNKVVERPGVQVK